MHATLPAADLTPYMSCRSRHPRTWQSRSAAAAAEMQQRQEEHDYHEQQRTEHSSEVQQQIGPKPPPGAFPAAAAEQAQQPLDVGRAVYRLHAVLVHAGLSATSGHYFTFVRDGLGPSGWHCANDSSVYR